MCCNGLRLPLQQLNRMQQISAVTAFAGLLLCFVLSIALLVYRAVRSLPVLEKARRSHHKLSAALACPAE